MQQNYWNIEIEEERAFWKAYIIGIFIIPAEHCPYCITGKIGLKNNDSINNPLQAKCLNYKCTRNISLRKGTIFAFQSKTPVSILYKIIKFWISENKNAKQIKLKLEEENHKETVNSKLIYETLTICRKAIATYIINIYQIERLAFTNANNVIAMDESLFTHINNTQQWVVGMIHITTKNIRIKIVNDRTTEALKMIIAKHLVEEILFIQIYG